MSRRPRDSFKRRPAEANWLSRELATCQTLMPQLDLHVMFGDDMPDTEPMLELMDRNLRNGFRMSDEDYTCFMGILDHRYQTLEHVLTERFNSPEIGVKFARECQEQDFRLAYPLCVSDSQTDSHKIQNTCGERLQLQGAVPPTHAFILLAPRFFDSVSALSFATNLPVDECWHRSPKAMHLPDFLHERGHLEMATRRDPLIPWLEERNADMTATATLCDYRHPAEARHYLYFRSVMNFLGQVSESASAYWNVLSQQQHVPFSTEGILRDKSATLELKRRAARHLNNSDPLPDKPCSELKQLMLSLYSPKHEGLRDLYSSMSPTSALERKVLMHALDRVVEEDVFTYPETRQLAHLTQAATHRLFPVVMAEKRKYLPYLRQSAPTSAPAV